MGKDDVPTSSSPGVVAIDLAICNFKSEQVVINECDRKEAHMANLITRTEKTCVSHLRIRIRLFLCLILFASLISGHGEVPSPSARAHS